MDPITKADLVALVRAEVKKHTTHLKASTRLKVTPAQLSKTLRGKANVVPERLARSMGYKPVLMYVPIKPAKKAKDVGAKASPVAEPKKGPEPAKEETVGEIWQDIYAIAEPQKNVVRLGR